MKRTITLLAATLLIAGTSVAQINRTGRTGNIPNFNKRLTATAVVQHHASKAVGDTVSNLPWTEGFENDDWNWTFISGNEGDEGFSIQTNGYYDYTNMGESCLFGAYSDYFDVDQWAISPVIVLPEDEADTILSFYVYMTEYEGIQTSYEVRISTNGADTSNFNTVLFSETGYSNDAFVKRSVSLSEYGGQAIRIAIRNVTLMGGDACLFDDIRIGGLELPTLTVSAPTSAISGTPVVISALSDATSFAWEVDGTAVSETSATLTHTFTTTGTHTVKVTVTNSVGSVDSTVSINVIDCNPIDIPTQFSFADGIGLCWENPQDGWDTISSGDETYVYSVSAINYYNYFIIDNDCDNWLITPTMNITSAGAYQVEWDVMEWAQQYATDHYSVYLIADGDSTVLFTETLDATAYMDPQHRLVALPESLTGEFKIAFRHHESTGGYVLLVTNFEVATQGVPTVSVSGPASAIVGDAVTFTAVSYTASSYAWTVDGTAVSGSAATLSHTFTTAGSHTVSVVASNAFGSSSPASTTINIITCEAVTDLPWVATFETESDVACWKFVDADGDGFNWEHIIYEQTHYGYDNSIGLLMSASYDGSSQLALTPDNWAISPAIVLPNDTDITLSWAARGQDTSAEYCGEHYSVYVSTTGNNPSDFSQAPVFEETTTGQYALHQVSLANYAGQTIRVAFRHHNITDKFYLDIDNVRVSSQAVAGIEDADKIDVSIYPNPATDFVTVEGLEIGAQLSLVDINGRVIRSAQSQGSSVEMNLSNLASGTYFIRIAEQGTTVVKRLVIR